MHGHDDEPSPASDLDDALAAAHAEGVPQSQGSAREGRGHIDTVMVVVVLSAETVQAMLPAGLQLGPQPLVPAGRHPLLISLAHDHFDAWFGDMDYREAMFAIPWVELADERAPHRGPFVYMPRLYLDAAMPQVLGERVYGYEKLAATIEANAGSFTATDEQGDLLVRARFEQDGEPRSPDGWPNFAWVRKLFEQPTVSQARRRLDRDAREAAAADQRLLGSCVRYLLGGVDWDGREVAPTIQPMQVELQLGNGLTLPGGLPQHAIASPSLAAHVMGAFRMRAQQVVSLPGSVAEVRYDAPLGRPLKVAVLGGGPAACSAAFWLARQRGAYQVSIFTQGWRMGGKCAASRNPDACDRIEEHGLHAFPGFYRNAFRTVREVYRILERPLSSPEGPLAAAFRSQPHVGVFDRHRDAWRYFPTPLDPNPREPGVVPQRGGEVPLRLGDALQRMFARAGDDAATLAEREAADEGRIERSLAALGRGWQQALGGVLEWFAQASGNAIEAFVETPPAASPLKRTLLATLRHVRDALAWYWRDRQDDADAWFTWGGLDTVLTLAIGVLEESTLDFDELDEHDFVTWMRHWGLAPEHAAVSSLMLVYETLFAHLDDRAPYRMGELACGVALRWFLLVSFGYEGAPAYDFGWSCAETLITPYYQALRQLGTEVHFFHRVERLGFAGSGDDKQLSRVHLRVQATVAEGREYQPLRLDYDPPAWPMTPDWSQLREGAELRERGIDLECAYDGWPGVGERVLVQGDDFDVCVLAIPLGALPPVIDELIDPRSPHFDPNWHAFVDGTALTQTLSTQLWFRRDAAQLFDQRDAATGRSRVRGLATGFAQPQASFGELSHLIAHERWPAPAPVLLTYHTGALEGAVRLPSVGDATRGFPAAERLRARGIVEAWLRENHRGLFDGELTDFDALLDALAVPPEQECSGIERLWAQHFNIACQPSDLYVLSRPRQTRLRRAPHDSGARFLLLAGDWTKTDMNCGCVEGATQSGMLAARALSGHPIYIWRVGF